MCPHAIICVLIPIYVLILLYVFSLLRLYVSSYYYICVLILLYIQVKNAATLMQNVLMQMLLVYEALRY
jgi:hypothetical protein